MSTDNNCEMIKKKLHNKLKVISEYLTKYMVYYTYYEKKKEGTINEKYEYHLFNGEVLKFPDNYSRLYLGKLKLKDMIIENLKKEAKINPIFINWFEKNNLYVIKFLLLPSVIMEGTSRYIRNYEEGVKTNIYFLKKLPDIKIPIPPCLYIK